MHYLYDIDMRYLFICMIIRTLCILHFLNYKRNLTYIQSLAPELEVIGIPLIRCLEFWQTQGLNWWILENNTDVSGEGE